MKTLINSLVFSLPVLIFSQTYGPRNATSGVNSTVVGANAWSNTGNVVSSNNSDASVATLGVSNYLEAKGFGFTIPTTNVITGIQVEVEKSNSNVQNVSLLNAWTVGTSRPLSAGNNRILIVSISIENATSRNVTSVTYGGLALTQLMEVEINNGFYGKIEIWYLLEAQLRLCTGTAITYTFAPSTPTENFEIVSSGIYQNVDQTAPFYHTVGSTRNGGSGAYQIGSPINKSDGGMIITSVFCGNPPSPSQPLGNVNAFTVNSSFTEQIDYHAANPSFSTTGGVNEISHKSSVGTGTEQPSFTFSGTTNRLIAVGISLSRSKQTDNNIRLRKSTGYVGNNKALLGVDWPTADTYISYGGPGDLWGTTWTAAEINNVNFGIGISLDMQNGTATIDNIRITVFTSSILPIELINFLVKKNEEKVVLNWTTASERDNDYFTIERSKDGQNWEEIAVVKGAGNSVEEINYELTDENPFIGISYYRLTQYDFNGKATMLGIQSIEITSLEYVMYPMPVNQSMSLKGNDLANAKVSIFNSIGERVEVAQSFVGNEIHFDFNKVKSGTYFVKIENKEITKTQKISVLH